MRPRQTVDHFRDDTISGFSLLEEYVNDLSHESEPSAGSLTGAAGGAACGDLARISFTIDETAPESVIGEVTFGTEGCSATRAACACVTDLIDGMSVLDAARVTYDQIDRELGGLSPERQHAPMLAADALHRALSAAASSGVKLSDPDDNRVMVAVSGGVDSAVAALRERDRGVDVIAVTVKLWADPDTDGKKACCSPEAVLGARAVTHSMGMPHFTLDLESIFREKVVGGFVDGHNRGLTPNPCVLCNGEVRIGAMLDFAERAGADRLVTGHYAKVVRDREGALIAEGDDPNKDQSYMLTGLHPDIIDRLDFPLASMTKPEVRAIASDHGLAVAKKPESQDLCFLAGQNKKDFLRRHTDLDDQPGKILDEDDEAVGEHSGYRNFTVGQRRGIGIASTEPLYVLATNPAENTVKVGPRARLETDQVILRDVTLHRNGEEVDRVRLRYRSDPIPTTIDAGAGHHETVELQLEQPFAGVTPGQTAALMNGDVVVGHGKISKPR